jgi:hypothetical protein
MTSRPCDAYGLGPGVSPLRHYLSHRAAGNHSPLPVFDVTEYTDRNAHWNAAASDPYLHWLERPGQAVQAPPLSASPCAAVLERAGGTLGARPARHGQP